jgi:hypothetical protein
MNTPLVHWAEGLLYRGELDTTCNKMLHTAAVTTPVYVCSEYLRLLRELRDAPRHKLVDFRC